jgi:hypothetical protein
MGILLMATTMGIKLDRGFFIPFGQRGYDMRYRIDDNTVVILRIWRELEYRQLVHRRLFPPNKQRRAQP